MKWNHRIVDMSADNGNDPWYEVREVYYDEDGNVEGHTEAFIGHEDPEQIISVLQRMIEDIRRNPGVVKEQA